MLKALRLRLRALFDRSGTERDLDDELRFHIEQEAARHARAGLPAEEALRRARIAFGSMESAREAHRDQRGSRGVEDVLADVRYAARALWRDRALAVAGIVTLALGIGATTAVFSAVDAVMLRELPFREPSRLVQIWVENPDRGWHKNVVAPANYLDWRDRAGAFEGVAAYTDYQATVTLLGRDEPTLLTAAYTTGNFLGVLGVRPQQGRGFEPGDEWDNGQRPVIISDRVWRTHFGADPGVVGQSMSLGGSRPWQIVGVMPAGFSLPSPGTDVWMPMLWRPDQREAVSFRRAHWLRVVARMQPGVTPTQANASLQTVVRQLQAEYPATNTRMGAGITPLHEWIIGDTRMPLLVLLSAAGLLLLIACANVGSLLLVHALGRSRDVSLRFALGATRGRVARQAVTESLVLSGLGGIAGLAIGWAGAKALMAMQPAGMLPITEIAVDVRVFLFALALTTLSGLAFGMAPAVMATRQSPANALNSASRTVTSRPIRRWGRWLVMGEVALAVTLTIGAGLLLRSFERLSRQPAGFDPEGVLTASLSIPGTRYATPASVKDFYQQLVERAGALPGVELAAAVRALPVTEPSWSSSFAVRGRPPMEQAADVLHREVLGPYFQVMRVPLVAGRTFAASDRDGAAQVVVINDAMARQYFPGEDPIGQQITYDRVPDSTSVWRTVIGVVGSERQGGLAMPARPEIFAHFFQDETSRMHLVMRAESRTDPAALAQPVRRLVRDLDSLLALNSLRPMTEVHAHATSRERFTSVLVLVFAITGVLLALVGVFGVLAQLVQARWREMGIRLALGAQPSDVRGLIAGHGARLLIPGIAAGVLVALATTRVLGSLLYEIRPTDWATYVIVALLVALTGMFAAWLPAWRAGRANPVSTLRAD
ncbi:MAG: ABC transporter permease [Gemmatimonadaceae bacterium]